MTSKELVLSTLEFRNTSGRVPRDLWTLPWAFEHYPEETRDILSSFEWDLCGPEVVYHQTSRVEKGDPYEAGDYTDPWGCTFHNVSRGIIGEVKQPLIDPEDEEWEDQSRITIPEEQLSFDIEQVNRSCAERKDKFLTAGCCPRPFEQLQFIRGTQQLYIDLMLRPKKMFDFLEKMHDFYCRLMEKWARTDVDALSFMDDWGTQKSLLISPQLWVEIFKPMYRDYIDIAHKHGKKIFMHSDGYTLAIIPHLIELGLDALNTQIFCMGVEKLRPFRGKITFWGEICRQRIIPYGTREEVEAAVRSVYDGLWDNGGCIAQCEFGAGANPENVKTIFRTWEAVRKDQNAE